MPAMELKTTHPYALNDRYGDEYKTVFCVTVWQKTFHRYLESITKLIAEIFIRVYVHYHHMSLVGNLIQGWALIPETCGKLFTL